MSAGGYEIEIDRRAYSGYRDGRPFTLADCWREVYGVRGARIVDGTGRVVLDNAGSMTRRGYELRQAAAGLRRARRNRVAAAGARAAGHEEHAAQLDACALDEEVRAGYLTGRPIRLPRRQLP